MSLPVRVRDLTSWAEMRVEKSPGRKRLIEEWARTDILETTGKREAYGVGSAVQAMMTQALKGQIEGAPFLPIAGGPLVTWRVHCGARPWRVPAEAFGGWNGAGDLEMTWSVGRLWERHAAPGFEALAWLDLQLLTTVAEGDAFKRAIDSLVAMAERKEGSELKNGQYIRLPYSPDDDPPLPSGEAWAAELLAKPKWSLLELLVWVAFRDAETIAAAFGPHAYWWGAFTDRREGRVDLVLAIIEHKDSAREKRPGPVVERAVQRQGLVASGVAPASHATHSLEDLRFMDFWREDAVRMWPPEAPPVNEIGAPPTSPLALARAEVKTLVAQRFDTNGRISQQDAVSYIKSLDPLFDRGVVREIVREITGRRGRGRPSNKSA